MRSNHDSGTAELVQVTQLPGAMLLVCHGWDPAPHPALEKFVLVLRTGWKVFPALFLFQELLVVARKAIWCLKSELLAVFSAASLMTPFLPRPLTNTREKGFAFRMWTRPLWLRGGRWRGQAPAQRREAAPVRAPAHRPPIPMAKQHPPRRCSLATPQTAVTQTLSSSSRTECRGNGRLSWLTLAP